MMFSFHSAASARNISPSSRLPPTPTVAGSCWGGGGLRGVSGGVVVSEAPPTFPPGSFFCLFVRARNHFLPIQQMERKRRETCSGPALPRVAIGGTALHFGGLLLPGCVLHCPLLTMSGLHCVVMMSKSCTSVTVHCLVTQLAYNQCEPGRQYIPSCTALTSNPSVEMVSRPVGGASRELGTQP